MSLGFALSVRNARAQAVVDHLDKAALPGSLAIFATAQPSTGDPPGGAPLASIPLQKPCGTVANGVITFNVTQPGQVNPGGTAVWARGYDGDGNFVVDGNVAVTGTPGAAFTLDNVVLLLGAFVFLSAATLSEP